MVSMQFPYADFFVYIVVHLSFYHRPSHCLRFRKLSEQRWGNLRAEISWLFWLSYMWFLYFTLVGLLFFGYVENFAWIILQLSSLVYVCYARLYGLLLFLTEHLLPSSILWWPTGRHDKLISIDDENLCLWSLDVSKKTAQVWSLWCLICSLWDWYICTTKTHVCYTCLQIHISSKSKKENTYQFKVTCYYYSSYRYVS